MWRQGGENPELLKGTGFTGARPDTQRLQTPNVLAASVGGGGGSLAATPARSSVGGTPLRGATPLRDELGINRRNGAEAGALVLADDAAANRARQAAMRDELLHGLRSLPKPQYAYEIEAPDLGAVREADGGAAMEEDAADVAARHEAAEAEARELERRRQSQAVQRGLPRPAAVNADMAPDGVVIDDADEAAGNPESLLLAEMALMLQHDHVAHPVPGARRRKKHPHRAAHLTRYSDEELGAARELLAVEVARVQEEAGEVHAEAFERAWTAAFRDRVFVPSLGAFASLAELAPAQQVEALRHQHEAAREQMAKDAQRAQKLESKLGVLTGGYQKRADSLVSTVQEQHDRLRNVAIERDCYATLAASEEMALPVRLDRARAEVQELRERETLLQQRYSALLAERDDLYLALQAAPVAAGGQ